MSTSTQRRSAVCTITMGLQLEIETSDNTGSVKVLLTRVAAQRLSEAMAAYASRNVSKAIALGAETTIAVENLMPQRVEAKSAGQLRLRGNPVKL